MRPQLNPQLTAVALELQPAVARVARDNVTRWNLAPRVRVEVGDLRQMAPTPDFDIAMMHNNIYYFPTLERAVLTHLAKFLKPGGRVLLTSFCRGYNRATEMLKNPRKVPTRYHRRRLLDQVEPTTRRADPGRDSNRDYDAIAAPRRGFAATSGGRRYRDCVKQTEVLMHIAS